MAKRFRTQLACPERTDATLRQVARWQVRQVEMRWLLVAVPVKPLAAAFAASRPGIG
jgi:hypothetical protein